MLDSVTIASEATFPPQPQTFGPLAKVNFVFGSNGSGKTTLSRVMADPPSYALNCSVNWEGNRPQAVYVFNRDFVVRNFDVSQEIKGVFTLGEQNIEIAKSIAEETNKINALTEKLKTLQSSLVGEHGIIAQICTKETEIETFCWDKLKTPNDDVFKGAFEGLRNNKAKFRQRVGE